MSFTVAKTIRQVAFGSAAILLAANGAHAVDITGAGSTFVYPIMAKWAEAYKAKTGTALNYQSVGSGAGIKQIKANTVDFGASDKPLPPDDIKSSGFVQFPAVIGGVVPVVNIPGIKPGEIVFDGKTLADVYRGVIKTWNDPALAKTNPGVKLPNMPITVVHRSDGSGTTFNFTYYLAAVNADWQAKVGADTAVEWPAGVGGKGNEGVAALTTQTPGAIGYVEYAYALQNKMTYTKMVNHDGITIEPNATSFQAAAANADWKSVPNYQLVLANQPGKNSWPMTAAVSILIYGKQDKPAVGKEVLNFFDWAYHNGQQLAGDLQYVPLPDNVVKLIEATWSSDVKDPDGKALWP
jgi:phosphate transport system substrate-binding protein